MQGTQVAAVKAIRLHLAAKNMSQAQLAARIGKSPFWLGRRMNSQIAFDVESLDCIASVFDTTLGRLLADAEAVAA